MDDTRPDSGYDQVPDPGDRTGPDALMSLYAYAGRVKAKPGLIPQSAREALRALAGASERQVPMATRLQVLHRLAMSDVPQDIPRDEYHQLADSVVAARGTDRAQLLDDIKTSALEEVPFVRLPSAEAFQHHEVAFLGQEVCRIDPVTVDGIRATSIYSDFTTDADFDTVAAWVDPRTWPKRGPLMFKSMDPVAPNPPAEIDPRLGDEHWHSVFHEEVQLVNRVNTLLHCDYWRDGSRAAGMTYDLDVSIDNQIDVDRGFLSVENLPDGTRRVRVLKIVSFTADIWDLFAATVCPFWTDWVRAAVEGGSDTSPAQGPVGEPQGKPDAAVPVRGNLAAWVDFFADSARSYVDLVGDASDKAMSGGYTQADWVDDGARYWSQLAKDWASAWQYGLSALDEVAERGWDAGIAPPGSPPQSARGAASGLAAAMAGAAGAGGRVRDAVAVPLPAGVAAAGVTSTALRSIEAGGATIPADRIVVTPSGDAAGAAGVQVATTDPTVPPGLYVGALHAPGGKELAPVQLYVSRAQGTGGS